MVTRVDPRVTRDLEGNMKSDVKIHIGMFLSMCCESAPCGATAMNNIALYEACREIIKSACDAKPKHMPRILENLQK